MRAMVWAQSPDRVIGANGTVPWRYPGDLKRFKRLTFGCAVVMGRATFESVGRALAGRRNVVVTRAHIAVPGIECVHSLDEALALVGTDDVWLIGGARIYSEGMASVDLIDVVYVPDHVEADDIVRAPVIDERIFEPSPLMPHEDELALTRRTYRRRATASAAPR